MHKIVLFFLTVVILINSLCATDFSFLCPSAVLGRKYHSAFQTIPFLQRVEQESTVYRLLIIAICAWLYAKKLNPVTHVQILSRTWCNTFLSFTMPILSKYKKQILLQVSLSHSYFSQLPTKWVPFHDSDANEHTHFSLSHDWSWATGYNRFHIHGIPQPTDY